MTFQGGENGLEVTPLLMHPCSLGRDSGSRTTLRGVSKRSTGHGPCFQAGPQDGFEASEKRCCRWSLRRSHRRTEKGQKEVGPVTV